MLSIPRAVALVLAASIVLGVASASSAAAATTPASTFPIQGIPQFNALPGGGAGAAAGPCGSSSASIGPGATAGTSAQVCGAGLTYIGPAIGEVASVIGPTVIGPAVIGVSVVSAGGGVVS
jgi:hypothetical protein